MKFKLVALLPMKANSERVKGKNFRELNGKPLFYWILNTLLKIKKIEKIIINTDARMILNSTGLVSDEKIEIRDRHETICGDNISMNQIIEDDIKNVDAESYLMTHTTNPLLKKETLEGAINEYYRQKKSDYDSLFSVNKLQTRLYDENIVPVNHDPNSLIRTQDLPPLYEENSNFYIFSSKSFHKNGSRIGQKPFMFICDPYESVDIDNENDWKTVETLIRGSK